MQMDIFNVLTMTGGLALFLFGMHVMGEGLSKASGGRLEKILEKLTSSTLRGVLLGAGVTAVIQSSSATTVMVVGFVNSGIMTLQRAVGIIMGANIGTTITSWLLSLSGLEGDSIFIKLLKPSSFAPVLAIIGVSFLLFSKKDRKKDAGEILIGFAVLMTGMDTMSSAVKPLAGVPEFTRLFLLFENPLLGMLAGALLTAVIQSSSASVGILQALCASGAVSYGAALPIILGQNIGTCVTALLSSIGAKKNAKRTAFVHLYFNLIGTLVFMAVFYGSNAVFHYSFLGMAANATGIALCHTAFNVLATLLWLPASGLLVKLAMLTVREEAGEERVSGSVYGDGAKTGNRLEHGNEAEYASGADHAVRAEQNPKDVHQKMHPEEMYLEGLQILDDRFLENPGYAMEQCRAACARMAEVTANALDEAIRQLTCFSEEKAALVQAGENVVDQYEDRLGTYLVHLAGRELQMKDSHTLSVLLHSIGDIERISDHAVLIVKAAQEICRKQLSFSESALQELAVISEAVREVVRITMEAMKTEDIELAQNVEPLEEVIDDLADEMKKRHVDRLRGGRCTIELGFILSDLTTSYRRIADHCSNIAVCLIQAERDVFGRHAYLNSLKGEDNLPFRMKFQEYRKKYEFPGPEQNTSR
jgi:phosphate:Na+ symporter